MFVIIMITEEGIIFKVHFSRIKETVLNIGLIRTYKAKQNKPFNMPQMRVKPTEIKILHPIASNGATLYKKVSNKKRNNIEPPNILAL